MEKKSIEAQRAAVSDFYDEFSARLLHDYVYGNIRIKAAISRVCSAIGPETRTVLDIGCGIGLSSSEYSRHHPMVQVHGVDISPRNIETARALFEQDCCTFDVQDVTDFAVNRRYDLVALLDVYEHIPRNEWPKFNKALANCLSDNGTLVLTCPSPLHQNWLAKNKPDGLQIIDETVTVEDVVSLAADIGGTVTHYQSVSIWNTHEYIHVVIVRNPKREPIHSSTTEVSSSFLSKVLKKLTPNHSGIESTVETRRLHVKKQLRVDV